MTIHIWCPRASDSAIKLRDAIREHGIKSYKTLEDTDERRFLRRIKDGDIFVNWGPRSERIPNKDIRVLNSAPMLNKMEQLIRLAHRGIPCPEVYASPGRGRIGRSLRHQCARDLINNTGRDYYTQKLEFTHEIRVHVFQGLSIHAGTKVHRIGYPNPHPWIRSYDTGWKIDYSQAHRIKSDRRELAKRAVEALGLDFGAVDIGVTQYGPAVIEVNLVPGLDSGPSVEAYVRHFIRIHGERTN